MISLFLMEQRSRKTRSYIKAYKIYKNYRKKELDMLIERYNEVKKHVEEACKRVGRDPREVTVIAVSKTKPLEMVEELRKEKVLDFGENKVQEIRDKYANISWPVRWHLIGHLQTNKIKYIVDKVALIHSVDSIKLAQAIDKEAAKHDVKEVPILIQVNFAHEDTKLSLIHI